jgi:hypothetical protein
MSTKDNFSFNISLSVLNHLGRNLYRSFVTVLGEAISNSWDADADNVWIELDKKNSSFIIKDDGDGMSSDDFQNKFLKVGYSKRKDGTSKSSKGRPFIGRKGIGKLALLSCAAKITIISKKEGGNYIGGSIDNAGLDQAIVDDLNTNEYQLGLWDDNIFKKHIKGHEKGTIILFENINGGIKNTLSYIKKIVALYFRFSLVDKNFNIFIDGEKITHKHMGEIGANTQFLWTINDFIDPYLEECLPFKKETTNIASTLNITGFIASVNKPSHVKIRETDEKVTVDLFVNGRLREKDIIKNIPTNRLVESYIYGQLHFDELDDNGDPFTSSREGVITDNHSYQLFLKEIKDKILPKIMSQWDSFRRKHSSDGDPEDTSKITRKARKSEELYNAVALDFSPDEGDSNKTLIDEWVGELRGDASFCFESYAECYIAENVVRKYIMEKGMVLSPEAIKQVKEHKRREKIAKGAANLSIDTRKINHDLSYLSMAELAAVLDKGDNNDKIKDNSLLRDSIEYKPLRDALMHTALLSNNAKTRLTAVYENIKGRLKELLSF